MIRVEATVVLHAVDDTAADRAWFMLRALQRTGDVIVHITETSRQLEREDS